MQDSSSTLESIPNANALNKWSKSQTQTYELSVLIRIIFAE